MSERDYLIAGVIHELATEIRKAMPEKDKLKITEATGESRRVNAQEVSEVIHELAVEIRKHMPKEDKKARP